MMRSILLASAGALALTGAAFAADLPSRGPPPVFLPPPPVFSWTGLYLGGQMGYAWGNDSGNVNDFAIDPTDGDTIGTQFAGSQNSSPSGAIGGAHIGYNWQINQFVLGVEANVDATNYQGFSTLNNTTTFFDEGGFFDAGAMRNDIRSTIQGAFRGRVGWAWNNWLIYGTGGVAFTDVTTEYRGVGEFSEDITDGGFDSRTRTRVGWTAGGGIEYAYTPNWIFGVEYRYSDFGTFTDNGIFGTNFQPFPDFFSNVSVSHHLTENQIQARVSYKFDWWTPAPVVAKY
ncbi:MAG: outer membrane protein [Methylocella sp.]